MSMHHLHIFTFSSEMLSLLTGQDTCFFPFLVPSSYSRDIIILYFCEPFSVYIVFSSVQTWPPFIQYFHRLDQLPSFFCIWNIVGWRNKSEIIKLNCHTSKVLAAWHKAAVVRHQLPHPGPLKPLSAIFSAPCSFTWIKFSELNSICGYFILSYVSNVSY